MRSYDDRTLSQARKTEILERDGYLCVYCHEDATEVDHIIPWSYDHNNNDENLVACCRDCNAIAGNKVFDTLQAKYRYIYKARKRKKYKRKKRSECADCGKLFKPRSKGSTSLLCADCYELAQMTPYDRKIFKLLMVSYGNKKIVKAVLDANERNPVHRPLRPKPISIPKQDVPQKEPPWTEIVNNLRTSFHLIIVTPEVYTEYVEPLLFGNYKEALARLRKEAKRY